MKRHLCLLLVSAMLLSTIPMVALAGAFDEYPEQFAKLENAVVLVVDTPTAAVNMKKVAIDSENPNVKPLIIDSRTLVPVRFIAESFGAEVGWNPDTAEATVNLEGREVKLVMNSDTMLVDGQATTLDVPAQSIEGRTMIPLRAMVESVGKEVLWDPKGMIVISDQPDILDLEADAAFIDTLMAAIKGEGEIEAPETGAIFDNKEVEDVIDFDKVEEPFYIRDGLPNVNAKLQSGEGEVKVAYLGGSITEAGGYRTLTDYYLEDNYKNTITSLNAGVGGTPSDFGALRFGTDIVPFDTDLLFVEFAVNDNGRDAKSIVQSMEGIVRQAWANKPTMDIIFVYTLRDTSVETAAEGKYHREAKIHDYIAEHYGIPSVYMGYQVAKDCKDGKLIFNRNNPGDLENVPVFSEDGVHPNADGSDMYMEMLEQAYEQLLTEDAVAGEFEHELKDPLLSNNWGNIKTYEPKDATYTDGFSVMDSSGDISRIWGNRASYALAAQEVGESLTIKFEGTQAGMIYLPGPDAPNIDVIIDGETIRDLTLFDVWHGVTGYTMLSYMTPELPYGEHTVEFKINDTKVDKAQLIKDSNYNVTNGLKMMEDNPDWFESINFIVGKVLVNGELIQ